MKSMSETTFFYGAVGWIAIFSQCPTRAPHGKFQTGNFSKISKVFSDRENLKNSKSFQTGIPDQENVQSSKFFQTGISDREKREKFKVFSGKEERERFKVFSDEDFRQEKT